MYCKLARRNPLFVHGEGNKAFGKSCAFTFGYHPTDDVAAEDVHDDIEIVVRPFGWSKQFGDVPGPHLVWACGKQLGLLVVGMAQLVTALSHLAVFLQDAVHGPDGAEVDPVLVE